MRAEVGPWQCLCLKENTGAVRTFFCWATALRGSLSIFTLGLRAKRQTDTRGRETRRHLSADAIEWLCAYQTEMALGRAFRDPTRSSG